MIRVPAIFYGRACAMVGFAALLIAASAASLTYGAVSVPLPRLLDILASILDWNRLSTVDDQFSAIVLAIRLPRLVLGVLVGCALGISGTLAQALFRNPLAEPGLIGLQSGAALGAALMIVIAPGVAFGVPLAAFVGGLISTIIVVSIARRQGQTPLSTLLLAGIAINALVGAITGFLTYLASEQQLRSLTFWTLGSLGGATWETVNTAALLIGVSLLLAPFLAKPLNALCLGEAQAMHLGIRVERLKICGIALTALAVGASVAACGMIGFVGLVVPHLVRLLVGPDHRWLLPGSALLGAGLLVLADLVARTAVTPAELPIGILTAAVGGPFFLSLLMTARHRSAHGIGV